MTAKKKNSMLASQDMLDALVLAKHGKKKALNKLPALLLVDLQNLDLLSADLEVTKFGQVLLDFAEKFDGLKV